MRILKRSLFFLLLTAIVSCQPKGDIFTTLEFPEAIFVEIIDSSEIFESDTEINLLELNEVKGLGPGALFFALNDIAIEVSSFNGNEDIEISEAKLIFSDIDNNLSPVSVALENFKPAEINGADASLVTISSAERDAITAILDNTGYIKMKVEMVGSHDPARFTFRVYFSINVKLSKV